MTRRLAGESFVRAFAQHILQPGFQKVRYYGFMSPSNTPQLADVRWLVWLWKGWTYWLGSAMFQPELPKRRPPVCKQCRGELELIGMTNADGSLLWQRLFPKRGPPYAAPLAQR